MTADEMETYRLHRRFDRMGRLVGDAKMKKLMGSHVMVIGLGGVGSWAAEMILRSGVGELTIVDFDEICVTNFNRQLHALQGMVGQQKVDVLAERFEKVNPQAKIHAIAKFYNFESSAEIFARRPDYVVDAIDNITAKCHLLHHCVSEGIPVVSATGSGGKLDPLRVQVRDLAQTEADPLARSVRRILRERYGFPVKGPFGIPAVYSDEPAMMPEELHYDGGKGFRCVCPQGDNEYFQCDNRNIILGNAGFVTGAFGMACASVVVRGLIETP
ncbi:MAG: tRNA threonylcarbamoyladenosine dehydratase [Oligoflexia bacterium]|nr:tRNA threonylcarbamoyladenosine dehydratase [Oligoflexia bacterium]